MSLFSLLGSVCKIVASVVCDDNGHPYRDDNGGWLPNNEYDLDGVHYATDDNGSVYSADGAYYPDDQFELGGTVFTTDSNGEVNTK